MHDDEQGNEKRAGDLRAPLSLVAIALPTALFGLCTFILMSTGVLGDTAIAGREVDELAYNMREGLKLAGFLLYGVVSWRRPLDFSNGASKGLLALLAVLYAGCGFATHAMSFGSLLTAVVMIMSLVSGFAGGIVYEQVAMLAAVEADAGSGTLDAKHGAATRTLGVVVGVGGALATLAQYVLQLQISLGGWFIALLAVCFCFLMYLVNVGAGKLNGNREPAAGALEEASRRKQVLYLVAVVVCLFGLFPFFEVTMRNVSTWVVFYQWHRLFLVASYLAIGAAAFLGGRRIVNLAVAVVAVFAAFVLAQTALLQADGFTVALFYALAGAVVAYSGIAFMSLAPQTAHPAFVASASRMLDGVVTIAGGAVVSLVGGWSASVVLMGALALIALTIVLMVIGGFFARRENYAEDIESPRDRLAPSAEERVQSLARECGLTDRESEVLFHLVLTEEKNQQIADDLGISRRQLQTHISRIYEKTGTQTRAGLVMRVGVS